MRWRPFPAAAHTLLIYLKLHIIVAHRTRLFTIHRTRVTTLFVVDGVFRASLIGGMRGASRGGPSADWIRGLGGFINFGVSVADRTRRGWRRGLACFTNHLDGDL